MRGMLAAMRRTTGPRPTRLPTASPPTRPAPISTRSCWRAASASGQDARSPWPPADPEADGPGRALPPRRPEV